MTDKTHLIKTTKGIAIHDRLLTGRGRVRLDKILEKEGTQVKFKIKQSPDGLEEKQGCVS